MRKLYAEILKLFFCKKLLQCRGSLGLSQEEMAHRLLMAPRSYIDLEHGKTCCGALTLALFLVYFCDDPMTFLTELQHAFERNDPKAA